MSDTLYIKMDQSVELTHSDVTVNDVAKLECKNKNIINKLKPIKLLSDHSDGKKRYIVSIMKIIEIVDENFQNVDVQNIGETDCVVEFKKGSKTKSYIDIIKVTFICFVLFFGAGFSIMSFNNDISLDEMFEHVSELVSGSKAYGKSILSIFYSVGLGLGITVFYNHFGAKKLSKDPTPIEVEMRKYEQDINTTLIDGHNRQDGKLDVE